MSYATDGKLYASRWTTARSASAVIAADNSTLTDANIPVAQAIDCSGLETILVRVGITGGSGPTMTLEALFRDGDAADGSRWVRRVNGSGAITTAALVPGQEYELTVDGWNSVFLRITAVANSGSTTAWSIMARPGKRARQRIAGAR